VIVSVQALSAPASVRTACVYQSSDRNDTSARQQQSASLTVSQYSCS